MTGDVGKSGLGCTEAGPDLSDISHRFRRLQENIPGMVYLFVRHPDGSSCFLYVNDASRRLFGVEPEELMRDWTLVSGLIHPADRARFTASVKVSAETLQPWREELRHIVNGEVRWYDCMSRPERQPNGDVLWDGIILETTERRRAEEALREGEERFRSTFEQAAVGIAHVGLDGTWLRVNQRLCDIVGYPRDELMKLRFQDITHPDDLATDLEYIRERLGGALQVHAIEKRCIRGDGSLVWINLTVSLVRYASGEPRHFISVIEDISARKDAEEVQQAHLQLLTSMERIEQAVRPATDLDQMMRDVLETVLLIFNCDRAWLLYPCDPDSPSWRVPMERTVPEYPGAQFLNREIPMQPWVAEIVKKAGESNGAVQFGPPGETPVPAEGRAQFQIQSVMAMAVYPKGDKPWVFGLHQCSFPRSWSADEKMLFQEIGRRIADSLTNLLGFRNLQQSEYRFRTLVENIPGFVYRCELGDRWRLEYVSESALELTGYSADQFTGAPNLNFGDLILAEDLPAVRRAVEEGVAGRRHYEIEYRIRHASGEIRWVSEKGRASYDEDGNPIWLDGVIIDITERTRTEMQVREYADRQAVLLREVNHRVKNNLAAVIGMLHKEEDLATARGRTSLLPILHELEGRLRGLLTVHSMFSATNWQPVLLSQLCKRVVSGVLKPNAGGIQLTIATSEVLVGSNQAHHLSMVLSELATNALKYAVQEAGQTCIHIDIEEEIGMVLLTFRDNGPGYPESIIQGQYAGPSVGFDLLTGIVQKSLRGTLSFRNENGAVAETHFATSLQ